MSFGNPGLEDQPHAEQLSALATVEDLGYPDSHGPLGGLGNLALVPRETESLHTVEETNRLNEVYSLTRNPVTYEVTVKSNISREDFERVTHPDDWNYITDLAETLKGSNWVFINPTWEGGGVAMIRPTAVHLLSKLGINAHWGVMEPIKDTAKGNPFVFTKHMHNASQRMTDEGLSQEGKDLHWYWADEENGPVLEKQDYVRDADFIIIDDPQPTPLIKRLKLANPHAKFIWRNHIDTDGELMSDPATPQGEVASYLLDECGVRDVDAVITHPVQQFVHPELDGKTYFAPATFDHFDNLNRHLSELEIVAGIEFINSEIVSKNEELKAAGREADSQPLLSLNPDKKRITLIARFDESKGMDKAIEMGAQTRQKMRAMGVPEEDLPEVVIVGNGSRDDPSGVPMFEKMLDIRREYQDEMGSITLMRLKHNYDAMNALISRSHIIMQTSDAEGLETRVSDAIKHGKPVVVSNRGGIKTQVAEGKSGIVLDYDKPGHDLNRGSDFMVALLTNPAAYEAMVETTKEQAEVYNLREFTTPANVARFLRIANILRSEPGRGADKTWLMSELSKIHAEKPQPAA